MAMNEFGLTMNPITSEEDVLLDDGSIDFRLDILRLTFTIEHLLENKISNVFKKKSKINIDELSEWMDDDQIKNLKDLCSQEDKGFLKNSIIINGGTGKVEVFLLDNFLNNSQFGDTLKLLKMIRIIKIREVFKDVMKEVDFSTLKKWYWFIKDIRNMLAHRSKIDPLHFFEKLSIPATPNKQGKDKFKSLSDIDKRKFVIKHLLERELQKDNVNAIIEKRF